MTGLDLSSPVAVVGTGTMGQGIAQVALVAGHRVRLYDAAPGRAREAADAIGARLDRLVEKDRLTAADRDAARARLAAAEHLTDLADCTLVVEAVLERLDVKQQLFRELEDIVVEDCLLATNTSSLSVTAIMRRPAPPGPLRGPALLQPRPAAAAGRGRLRVRHRRLLGHARVRDGPRVGQDAGRLRRHPGLHRQPHRPALLRRGVRGLRGPGRRARHHRRGHARVRRLQDGPLRTDRPDRPGRQRVRDALRVAGLLPGRALHALAGPAAAGRVGPASAARADRAGTTTRTAPSATSRTQRSSTRRLRTSSPRATWAPRPNCSP